VTVSKVHSAQLVVASQLDFRGIHVKPPRIGRALGRALAAGDFMKRWIAALIGLTGLGYLVACDRTPADFHEQFITLPSGKQAYCNRQGYREVLRTYNYERNILVTDPDGNFVPCDAKVGPPWDNARLDADGDLLTVEQMDKALTLQREEEANSPEAQQRRREQLEGEKKRQAHADYQQHLIMALGRCPQQTARENEWYDKVDLNSSIDWIDRNTSFANACDLEARAIAAQAQANERVQQAEEKRIAAAEAQCRAPYDAAYKAYMNNLTEEGGRQVNAASVRMDACLDAIEKKPIE
jgi:hypothetical protein